MIHHKQLALTDCGYACLKTLLSCVGKKTINVSSSHQDEQGLSLDDLEKLLLKEGITSDSYQITDFEELFKVEVPYLMVVDRVGLPHYIVVVEVDKDKELVTISDPAEENVSTLSYQELMKKSLGVVLIPNFNKMTIKQLKTEQFNHGQSLFFQSFMKTLSKKDQILLFLFGILKITLPLCIAFLLQVMIINHLYLLLSSKLFYSFSILGLVVIYWFVSEWETALKASVEHHFLKDVLVNYFQEKIDNYKITTDYEYVSSYFWNLLLSATGIAHYFYLRVYIFCHTILLLLLLYFNPLVFFATLLALLYLFFYEKKQLERLAGNQRDFVASSSNFSSFVENAILGIYDIFAFKEQKQFTEEFNNRLRQLLLTKERDSQNTNYIFSAVQAFIGVTGLGVFILLTLFGDYSSITNNINTVLVVLLFSNVLNPLLQSLVVLKKSQYSLEFIQNQDIKPISKEVVKLPFNKINELSCDHLFKKWGELEILKPFKGEFEAGQVSLISGINGSGKTTLLKILQGLCSPDSGKITINQTYSVSSLKSSNILDYMSIYSPEFKVFPGSVQQNIDFSLFNSLPLDHSLTFDFSLGISPFYQVSSKGKNISKGQEQKLLLLRAFNQDKDIYIFDEPTGNLDREAIDIFITKIEELAFKQKLVIIVSHDDKLIDKFGIKYKLS